MFFGSKCTVLKKVLVIMLGLFGARSSDSEPPRSDLGSGEL